MSIQTILVLAGASAFSLFILLYYLPIHSTIFGFIHYSPRLFVSWFFPVFDVFVTLYLVCGSWFGISGTVTGIGMTTFHISTAIGLTLSALAVRKFFGPRWRTKYQQIKCS